MQHVWRYVATYENYYKGIKNSQKALNFPADGYTNKMCVQSKMKIFPLNSVE